MRWFTLTLFAIWLVIAVVWLASNLKDARRKISRLLNPKQRRLSLVFLALFISSLLVVPWRVDAQLLGFPIFSHISYGLIWSPPSGGINQGLVGIVSPQGGILFGWMLVEWIVLAVFYWFFRRVFRGSDSDKPKHDDNVGKSQTMMPPMMVQESRIK
jgi:hypothetical protein